MSPDPENKTSVWPFSLKSLRDLRELCARWNVALEADEDLSILGRPVKVGKLTAPNALAIHPMEGCDGDAQGRPGDLTRRRYERFAGGGAGLIWAEAIAVVPEGRANPRQLWLHEQSAESFRELVEMMRKTAAAKFGTGHRPILVAQLTHSGRYSRPERAPHPLIPQRDPYRDARQHLPADWPVLTDDYLDALPERYVQATRLAFAAGFDAVDVKACHGYLLNELLACHTRGGKYGGSFENRTRLLLEIVDRLRAEFPGQMVVTRLGVYDAIAHPYGWGVDPSDVMRPDLAEPKRLVAELAQRGVAMVNVTAANPYYNPHVNRPYNEPVQGIGPDPEHPIVGVHRMMRLAAEIQKAQPNVAVVGSGYSWLRTLMPHVMAAQKRLGEIAFAGAGRMAFAYPDFAADILTRGGLDEHKICVACSACTQIMRDGGMAGCVIRDGAVYRPIYRAGRRGNRENLLRLASGCRQCQDATCTLHCPAGIDIPAFLRLFREGDDRGAYEVVRRGNLLPEICASMCPVEQQCQGGCLEGFLGDESLPIADIQRYLARQANAHGWSKVRLPASTSGRRVAVVGAGPAGLACAIRLLEAGHRVTIFDKSQAMGGLVESVIPAARGSKAIREELAAIFRDVPADRLEFVPGRELGVNLDLDAVLRDGFDAAFIGVGLTESSGGSGEHLRGLHDALEFLSLAKRGELSAAGKTVAVIGGGNTAMDCAMTAKACGARDVYLIYRRSFAEMPAWPAERDTAVSAGVHFLILTQQAGYLSSGGSVSGLRLCPTRLGEPDASGRRTPVPVANHSYELGADLVVEAIGQQVSPTVQGALQGVSFQDGLIVTREGTLGTSRQNVFAGGDIAHGPSTVVAAVADGMQAADEIDRQLHTRTE